MELMSTCHGRYVHIMMYNNMEYQSLITGSEAYIDIARSKGHTVIVQLLERRR